MEGLGRSVTAQTYALSGVDEARAYLRDPVLCARYEEIAQMVKEKLAQGCALDGLFGSSLDARKLVSSLTLFRAAARSLAGADKSYEQLATLCHLLLDQAVKQGYERCGLTLDRLGTRELCK